MTTAPDWQPIESAPKDGTAVLLFLPDRSPGYGVCIGRYVHTTHIRNGKIEHDEQSWRIDGGFTAWSSALPSLWMPLPQAPA